jgi:two-component system response regulator AtoC
VSARLERRAVASLDSLLLRRARWHGEELTPARRYAYTRILSGSHDPSPAALLVGRAAGDSRALEDALHVRRIRLGTALNATTALRELEACAYDALLVDLDDAGAASLVDAAVSQWPDLPIVLMGDPSHLDRGLGPLASGAADFLSRPFGPEQLVQSVVAQLGKVGRIQALEAGSTLRGKSRAMQQVADLVRRAAASAATVLVRGESGTGKDVVAHALHEQSARHGSPFVKVHCAGLPDTLLESELFGYEKGAFTGAVSKKSGRAELAEGGTLFLDEIGDITLAMQVKLLRLLQDRAYERLGSNETRHADVRFIAATHRDLDRMIQHGEFREDLFYRLNVVTVWLPALRARREDIETLAHDFCQRFSRANDRTMRLSDEAIEYLRVQRWPGNVRQLQNFIERLVVLCNGPTITLADVERESVDHGPFSTQSVAERSPSDPAEPGAPAQPTDAVKLADHLRDAERAALVRTLEQTHGNRSLAARVLGISRTTLYTKLIEHGLARAS